MLKTASYFAGSSGRAKGCSVLVFILIAQRSDTQHVDSAIWAFPKTKGTLFAGPRNEDYSILGPICGSPYLGKLPHSIYRAHLLEALSNHSNEAAIMGVLGSTGKSYLLLTLDVFQGRPLLPPQKRLRTKAQQVCDQQCPAFCVSTQELLKIMTSLGCFISIWHRGPEKGCDYTNLA